MSAFAIVFWLWFVVSTTIFIHRRIKARATKRATLPAPRATTTPPVGATGPDLRTPPWVAATRQAADPAPAPAVEPPPSAPAGPADNDAHRVSVRRAGHPTVGIAQALQGIHMPCDLAPLTLGVQDLDPDHVDLVTSGVGPDAVSSELTAELERLGYTVNDLGAGEHLADRDGTVVRVKVHDRPRLSVSSDGRGFTTAPPDGIVVEMTVV